MSKTEVSVGKRAASTPSESTYYVLVLFDISDSKKYRCLTRILKRYGTRIQKSVFEAQLRLSQIKELTGAIEKLMVATRFYNSDDNVRLYRMASNCELTVFGRYESTLTEENIFI